MFKSIALPKGQSAILLIAIVAVLAGIALRLVWPLDIEYKRDEQWTFEHAQAVAAGQPLPSVGMATSFGPPNPGLSLWFFAGLAQIGKVGTPPELARRVQWLNAAALVLFLLFARTAVEEARREMWLWATALWAVNPFAIIYERKIWPPSVLPIFTVVFIASWWHRRYFPAAILWGAVGALMAQMHIAAGFLSVSLALWTLYTDRRLSPLMGWLIGSLIGSIPAWPWLFDLAAGHHQSFAELRLPLLHFYLRWPTQPFGLGLGFFKGEETLRFLAWPLVAGVPTYIVALLHAVLAGLFVWMWALVFATIRQRGLPRRTVFIGDSPETVLFNASVWGYGGVLTVLSATGLVSARQYLIVVAPMMALWAAWLVIEWAAPQNRRRARHLLAAFCIAQAAISTCLLAYIDSRQILRGDYGATWQSQQPVSP